MAKTTFWDIIEQTIKKVGTPLSPKEIWDKARELGTIGDFVTTGKTPPPSRASCPCVGFVCRS